MTSELGASFSVKYCLELELKWRPVLIALLKDLGIRRLRLMSYWDRIEKQPGIYDFDELDEQMDLAAKFGASVSLAIGMRQPRWPECHIPPWASKLPKEEPHKTLYAFVSQVVERYRRHPALESWQLENEALNRNFGICPDFDRKRLQAELALVKRVDPKHPVIMSLSNSWGLPLRKPRPDIYGVSLYRTQFKNGRYTHSILPSWFYMLRAALIRTLTGMQVILHELQTEPWGPKASYEMTAAEQALSMDAEKMSRAIDFARRTGLRPIYLWGAEWWYWRNFKQKDASLWEAAKEIYRFSP